VGSAVVQALQSIVARNVDPLASAVVSVTTFNAGDTFNVIPQRARLTGTARSLDPLVRDLLERRIREIVQNVVSAFGGNVLFAYKRNYPVTVNHPAQTETAVAVASEIAGEGNVNANAPPVMGGEDFSYMLEVAARGFHLCRQWRHGRPSSSRLRLQRRRHRLRIVLLGAAGGAANAGGLIAARKAKPGGLRYRDFRRVAER
jgi:metal-dependent amidase/aminoacylase/carboxypeptidase family protein